MRLTLIFIFITQFCLGQNKFTFNAGGADRVNYYSVVKFEEVNRKMILDVKIGGKVYKFILDSGAPTMISSKVFNEIQPTILKKILVADANQAKDSLVVASLEEITIGDVAFKDIPTLVAQPNIIFDCLTVDGLIGSNLLRNSILQIDKNSNHITITDDSKKLNLKSKQSSKLFLDGQSNPYIWITLKNKKKAKEQLLFDTGMGGLYDLSIEHLSIFQRYEIFEELGKGNGSNAFGFLGAAKDTTIYRLRLSSMEINNTKLLNIVTETTIDNVSRIGASLLKYGIVTVDYRNKKFYFAPYTDSDIDVSEKIFPVNFVPRNNSLYVSTVWDTDLTGKINAGDQVISIDGINYESANICDWLLNLVLKDKDSITLITRNSSGNHVESLIKRK